MTDAGYHMPPEDFRRHGHAVVDWVADYLARVEELPITPDIEPGAIRAMLPATAPEQPEPFEAILADLDRVVMPGVVHWQSPGWFGYFPANGSGPAILGDLVSTGLGQQGMLWSTSPACTEIETVVLDWLVDLLGTPRHVADRRPRWRRHPDERLGLDPHRTGRGPAPRRGGSRPG